MSITYPQDDGPVLSNVSFVLYPGECHILRGPTGSGKSSLLKALGGLLSPDRIQGKIEVNDHHPAVILQNPETQMLSPTVGGEVAFGLENLGWSVSQMEVAVAESLQAVGLDLSWKTPTRSLSMGQKYKLLMAAFLCRQGRVFLVDEAGTQLNASGRRRLAACLLARKAAGCSLLLCEQDPGELQSCADRFWKVENGTIVPDQPVMPSFRPPSPTNAFSRAKERPVLEVSKLSLRAGGETLLVHEASFCLRSGELVLITGPNGSGKSTLIHCMAGFQKPAQGRVSVFGSPPSPTRLRGRMGLVLQNP